VSHQLSQRPILLQDLEVVQTFPAHGVQSHEALHIGRFVESTLPLLDLHVPFHALRPLQRPEGLHQQRHACQRREVCLFLFEVVGKRQSLFSR
jgi:hypothetical protein